MRTFVHDGEIFIYDRDVKTMLKDLEARLASERARRIKAEEVVDAAIKLGGAAGASMAQQYRAQYPRVEKENE